MTEIDSNRLFFRRFREALYNADASRLVNHLKFLFSDDATVQLAYPLGIMQGPGELFELAYLPLIQAIPDLERRDYIVLSGLDEGEHWMGCSGFYSGVFESPWLDIPATRHLVTMRYCEFFRIEDEQIVAMHGLWDIPELMLQARAWPLAPSLGRDILAPGPATQDGIVAGPHDTVRSAASFRLVDDMLTGLSQYSVGGTSAMGLERYWHPRMNWYGPAGIGSSRRLTGFRLWHQVPFLAGMPNRGNRTERPHRQCYIADGDYVAFCGFHAMYATISEDGWMGIAPGSGHEIAMTSLDFWRCENGLLRENWVLVDLLDIYRQIGVDVFSRMRELTADRQLNPPGL